MSQHPRIFLSPPHMTGREQTYIAEVFDTNYIAPVGPHLAKFEDAFAQYVGVDHAVAVVSGTAALHLALRQLRLQPTDEVLCSTLTFCASANPILYEGAQPVFIDSDRVSWNLDPNLVEEEVHECARKGKLPKAIIAVDLLGHSADMDAINEIAGKYDIAVIEDAAEALGGKYKNRSTGNSGWCNAFSFNGNKIITTSGGGMFCTNDGQAADTARHLATQARDPAPYYLHSMCGYNYRLSNVLAAIGLAQLEALDEIVLARRRILNRYREGLGDLPGINFMPEADFASSNCWLTSITIDNEQFGYTPEHIRQALESENIESRRLWNPMHKQPLFQNCRYRGRGVSDELFERGLNLPSGSGMSVGDVARVIAAVRDVVD